MTMSPNARLRSRTSTPPGRRRSDQRGVASAEYAVATAAGCGLAALLLKLLTSDFGQQLIEFLFDLVRKVIGA